MRNSQLEQLVLESREDQQKLNDLLEAYKPFIASCVQKLSGKYMRYGSDDELSVGMMAFVQAVKGYKPLYGEFLSYAGKVIRNKVIDYYRGQRKHTDNVVSLRPEQDEMDETIDQQASLASYEQERFRQDRVLEIQSLKETLARYDIHLSELENVSPKNKQTKQICKQVIQVITCSPRMKDETLKNGNLPLVQIEKELNITRKKFERHRKYIIAVLLIKMGDYPYLAEYVKDF
ncbi:MAG: RNA polymerase sigma-I factor [Thermoclostridium sp.]|nr:RNA polymerase sigma-I factor [Thermoclostridium sp.]